MDYTLPVDQWPDEPTIIGDWLYDKSKPDLVCEFFEVCLKHGTGSHAGKPFKLLPWQKQVIYDLFGTFHPKTGLRRFTTSYVEVPRKNGKSQFAAGIALWLLCGDGEAGAQVYSAAFTLKQASLVFAMASQMVLDDEALSSVLKVRKNSRTIFYEDKGSFYRAIPRDDKDAHGLNAHGIIFDELHNQPDRKLWDTLQTSRGMREQPLTIAITTAGHDRSSICYELHKQAKGIINGEFRDDSFYPVIYAAEPGDDWHDPEVWTKANPSIGHTVRVDFLQQECDRAKLTPSYENTFRNLYLNQWTEQAVRWLPMHAWDACRGEMPVTGIEWYAGLDLAESQDVCAFVLAGKKGETVYIKPFLFTPEEPSSKRAEQDKKQVMNWVSQGYIETLPGDIMLNKDLVPRVLEIIAEYDVKRITMDPWRSKEFVSAITESGYPEERILKFPQTMNHFAEPTRKMLDMVVTGKLIHDGNEALRWMAANTVVQQDANGNTRPAKDKSQDKIDGIVASIMAIREAIAPEPDGPMPVIY